MKKTKKLSLTALILIIILLIIAATVITFKRSSRIGERGCFEELEIFNKYNFKTKVLFY